eukprot:TRINITY_DN23974_c0_g1_i1.p1 TRINITY_DN23974_c0_g1~~TRINITY_DN23974_c0_g1_i1.p1  ORF type:complete len:417 (-),score=54.06 TRINITY_DN23974_c0_g1_i1:165-1415(-)
MSFSGGHGAAPPAAVRTGTGDAADRACMSVCFEPPVAETAEEWEYTGPNRGSYEKIETYQYVGPGRGSVEKVATTTYTGWRCRQACILLSCLIMVGLIAFLVWLLLRQQPAYEERDYTFTSVPFDCDAGFSNWQHGWSEMKQNYCCSTAQKGCHDDAQACVLWGDPHIKTFDKSRLVFYSAGDFWLVKTPTIQIQGRFQATDWTRNNDKTDYSSMTSIIVGGPFLGHKIEVQSMLGKIYCDGNEILPNFGDAYCGAGHVVYDSQGALVDQAMAFLPHKVVHLYLPGQVSMQVNRWPNFVNAKIVMSKREGQDGVCGNFNGVQSDDMGKELHDRFGQGVPQGELMFSNPIPLLIPQAMPSQKRCGGDRRKRAEAICAHESTEAGWSYAECLGDVCDADTGDQPSYQAQDMKDFFTHH